LQAHNEAMTSLVSRWNRCFIADNGVLGPASNKR